MLLNDMFSLTPASYHMTSHMVKLSSVVDPQFNENIYEERRVIFDLNDIFFDFQIFN